MPRKQGGSVTAPEEARLVERARDGDAAAYEALVRAHQTVAFRTACVITGDASVPKGTSFIHQFAVV